MGKVKDLDFKTYFHEFYEEKKSNIFEKVSENQTFHQLKYMAINSD